MTVSESKSVVASQLSALKTPAFKSFMSDSLKGVAIIYTDWYPEIIKALKSSAIDVLSQLEFPKERISEYNVPGAFEIPLMASKLLEKDDVSLVVTLGCVVKGGTPHFDFICQAVIQSLTDLQISSKKPVALGILTLNSIDDAEARKNKGAEAVIAALQMAYLVNNKGKA